MHSSPQNRRERAGRLQRWLALEGGGAPEERCEAALREALSGWAPFAPLPGFSGRVMAAVRLPSRAQAFTGHWGFRAAVALIAVQSALLLGLIGTTAGSLVERLGPSGVVAGLARVAVFSGRSLGELLGFGQSVADAARVVGSAAVNPGLLLLLVGCLAASAVGAWLVSSQLVRGHRDLAGAAP